MSDPFLVCSTVRPARAPKLLVNKTTDFQFPAAVGFLSVSVEDQAGPKFRQQSSYHSAARVFKVKNWPPPKSTKRQTGLLKGRLLWYRGGMVLQRTIYDRKRHAAARTSEFLFNQLIPYIGNKRKLLRLIHEAVEQTAVRAGATFVDFFAGSGVVSRWAKLLGYRVIANDWEPYARVINQCYIACNGPPSLAALGGYEQVINHLNRLPPRVGWVTEHLCPRDDVQFDVGRDRMFYMRKNGMRIDAIREQIAAWKEAQEITDREEACLLAPLLYQACYTSNTSGVFKGFHNGWGGQTGTALYRIAGDLRLAMPVFCDNGLENRVFCEDAQALAQRLAREEIHIAYLDPPYNQHPYGSNYHVLNSIALWDKPALGQQIARGTKAAIRTDWRTERRSAYNYRDQASRAYERLLTAIHARYILTSYSTDGMIPLESLLQSAVGRGRVSVVMQGYKRYRVSSQRFSRKPMNVEFVLVIDTRAASDVSAAELRRTICRHEAEVLDSHPEVAGG
jgi:adenine-specific DNA-methyltransferase